jgi:hypothetical protein
MHGAGELGQWRGTSRRGAAEECCHRCTKNACYERRRAVVECIQASSLACKAAALPRATVSNFCASAAATAPCASDDCNSLAAGTAATTLMLMMVTPYVLVILLAWATQVCIPFREALRYHRAVHSFIVLRDTDEGGGEDGCERTVSEGSAMRLEAWKACHEREASCESGRGRERAPEGVPSRTRVTSSG